VELKIDIRAAAAFLDEEVVKVHPLTDVPRCFVGNPLVADLEGQFNEFSRRGKEPDAPHVRRGSSGHETDP
jgi:hypothetical protein